jgi:hypothetical protein
MVLRRFVSALRTVFFIFTIFAQRYFTFGALIFNKFSITHLALKNLITINLVHDLRRVAYDPSAH